MIFVLVTQFHVYLLWVYARLTYCLNSVLNVKALVGAFNCDCETSNLAKSYYSPRCSYQGGVSGQHGRRGDDEDRDAGDGDTD